MKRLLIIIFLLPVALTDCSFLKATTLNPIRLVFIRNGTKPGQVVVKTDEYGLEDLSLGVNIYNGTICIADNELRRVQVVKPKGDVELIIGPMKNVSDKDTNTQKFNFGVIGYIAMDDSMIYIQNKFSHIRDSNTEAMSDNDSIDFSPSYILVFNRSGELQYTLGQKGTPDTPFYHIERLVVDSKGRLFVISRSTDSWSIYRFRGKKRDYFLNLGTLEFRDQEEGNVYEGKIDNIKIFDRGEKMLISVSYYHGLRLKYIKIFEFSIGSGRVERTVMEIPDPKNVLFDIIDDKYIYLWNVSNDEVKFEVSNLDGAIINNVYLNMKYKRNYYTRILLDESGQIYSYHIMGSGIDIVKWE
ncbi:MAG: hypothetical protein A2176_15430 [Spirochaetes bacterium RBG_13_51_14]|nr:MAG: hypothetical protein A2176_15430 [Spirochaetes bacterium RBG_13_51_14]